LDSLKSLVGPGSEGATQKLGECIQITEEAVKEIRTLSYLLYPPLLDELGLRSAIPWYVEGFAKRSGISTTIEIPSDFGRLTSETELAIFRVLQESLTNVHRHSGSLTAKVRVLIYDGMISLEVKDDGKGMSSGSLDGFQQDLPGTLGVGLRGMNERIRQLGGKLEVASTGHGTTIRATMPRPAALTHASD
jgi:signal transduction histidine kinase